MRNKAKIIHPHLGENIRVLRLKAKLTQKSLGEMLYKSESTVRMWELSKSEPDNETLLCLASIFGVSVDYLLGKEKPSAEDDELQGYLEELKNRPEMRMLFSLAKGATKEDVEQAVAIIEALRKSKNG